MTRTLTALIAALVVTATLAVDTAPVQATSLERADSFLSSGHTTGSNATRGTTRGISSGDLGSGR